MGDHEACRCLFAAVHDMARLREAPGRYLRRRIKSIFDDQWKGIAFAPLDVYRKACGAIAT